MLAILVALSLQQAPLALDAPRVGTEKRLAEIDFELKAIDPLWPTRGVVGIVTGYSVFAVMGGLSTTLIFAFLDARLTAATALAVGFAVYTAAILSGLGLILGTGALIWSAVRAGESTAQKRRLSEERARLTGDEFRRPADPTRM